MGPQRAAWTEVADRVNKAAGIDMTHLGHKGSTPALQDVMGAQSFATCYLSRARTGGVKGALGVAEDKAEASISCRQVGPISIPGPIAAQEEIFNERISLIFKRLRIVRMVDVKRNTLVYLTYSDRVIEGSP